MQVFLKYYHSERLLQTLAGFDRSATVLQSVVRGWQGRRNAVQVRKERAEKAAVKIQAGECCKLKFWATLLVKVVITLNTECMQ